MGNVPGGGMVDFSELDAIAGELNDVKSRSDID